MSILLKLGKTSGHSVDYGSNLFFMGKPDDFTTITHNIIFRKGRIEEAKSSLMFYRGDAAVVRSCS